MFWTISIFMSAGIAGSAVGDKTVKACTGRDPAPVRPAPPKTLRRLIVTLRDYRRR